MLKCAIEMCRYDIHLYKVWGGGGSQAGVCLLFRIKLRYVIDDIDQGRN